MALEIVTAVPTVTVGGNAPPAPAAPAPAPEPAAGTPADTAVDPKTVAHIARLSKEAREVKAKNTALEAAIKEAEAKAASTPAEVKAKAERLDRLEGLVKSGKRLSAMSELGAQFEEIIQEQLDADPDAVASPETLKALEEIEKLKAKDAERDKATQDAKDKEAREAAAAAGARAEAWVGDKIKSDAARWELCAKADGKEGRENAVVEVCTAVARKVNDIAAAKKAKGEAEDWRPNREEAEAMVLEGLDLAEAWLEGKGKLYTRQSAQSVQRSEHRGLEVTDNDIDSPKPAPTLGNDRGPTRTLTRPRTQMTAREARERLRAAFRE